MNIRLWANTSINIKDAKIHGGWFVNSEAKATLSSQHVNAQLNEHIWAILQMNGWWELFSYEQSTNLQSNFFSSSFCIFWQWM